MVDKKQQWVLQLLKVQAFMQQCFFLATIRCIWKYSFTRNHFWGSSKDLLWNRASHLVCSRLALAIFRRTLCHSSPEKSDMCFPSLLKKWPRTEFDFGACKSKIPKNIFAYILKKKKSVLFVYWNNTTGKYFHHVTWHWGNKEFIKCSLNY